MKACHEIRDLHFSGEYMILTIDGTEKKLRVKDVSPTLERASEEQRNTFEVFSFRLRHSLAPSRRRHCS
jgi:hypothetical protein